jgi:hypothetical protein
MPGTHGSLSWIDCHPAFLPGVSGRVRILIPRDATRSHIISLVSQRNKILTSIVVSDLIICRSSLVNPLSSGLLDSWPIRQVFHRNPCSLVLIHRLRHRHCEHGWKVGSTLAFYDARFLTIHFSHSYQSKSVQDLALYNRVMTPVGVGISVLADLAIAIILTSFLSSGRTGSDG